MKNFRVVSTLVTGSILFCAPLAVNAKEAAGATRGSCHEIVVKAKPEAVYNAIIKLREESQDTVKEVSRQANRCVLEEKFPGLPLIGEAKCVYEEVYTPCSRIEYTMVRSDRFKAFEGRWLISPTEDGNATKLSLSSYIDVDLPLPFAKQLCKVTTSHGVKDRLQEVKTVAERSQVAQSKARPAAQ